jgi:hypothetical protein
VPLEEELDLVALDAATRQLDAGAARVRDRVVATDHLPDEPSHGVPVLSS